MKINFKTLLILILCFYNIEIFAFSRSDSKYNYTGSWRNHILLNHSRSGIANFKTFNVRSLDSIAIGNLYRFTLKKCGLKSPRSKIAKLSWADLRAFDSFSGPGNISDFEDKVNFKFKKNSCSKKYKDKALEITEIYLEDLEIAVNKVLGIEIKQNNENKSNNITFID